MTLPADLTPAQRAAIISCLRIAAARGRAIREAEERAATSKQDVATAKREGQGKDEK